MSRHQQSQVNRQFAQTISIGFQAEHKNKAHMVYLPHEWSLRVPKFAMFKQVHFMAQLQLNAAKTNDYIKKYFKKKLFVIKFHTKKSVGAYVYLPKSGARGLQCLPCLKYYKVWKWESIFTLGLTRPKLPIILKKVSNKSCSEFNFIHGNMAVMIYFLMRALRI